MGCVCEFLEVMGFKHKFWKWQRNILNLIVRVYVLKEWLEQVACGRGFELEAKRARGGFC